MDLYKTSTPATDSQKGLFFTQKLAPLTLAYNIVFGFRIVNGVDVSRLSKAVRDIGDKYPILNAAFFYADDGDVHIKYCLDSIELDVHNLKEVGEAEAYDYVRSIVNKPFDLEVSAKTRFVLFRVDDKNAILVICAHHAIMDFWSLGLLLNDLPDIYKTTLGADTNSDNIKEQYLGCYNIPSVSIIN